MSPLRAYRCSAGHDVEVYERMSDDPLAACPETVSRDGDPLATCGEPVEPQIQRTQRPIVKSGTKTFHGRRPEGTMA